MSRPFSSGLKGRGKSATDGNPEDCCQLLCKSPVLVVGGRGLRFVVSSSRGSYPAFVIRCRTGVSAFLNICAHMDLELDWTAGRFFDSQRRHLICSTHGALYDPTDGLCIEGPCYGARLKAVEVSESCSQVFFSDDNYTLVRVEM